METNRIKKYGEITYGGNSFRAGKAEDNSRCIVEIWGDMWNPHQCSRKRGYGPAGLYCKQHSKNQQEEV